MTLPESASAVAAALLSLAVVAIIGAALTGLVAGSALSVLLIVGPALDLRDYFPNASPDLYNLISGAEFFELEDTEEDLKARHLGRTVDVEGHALRFDEETLLRAAARTRTPRRASTQNSCPHSRRPSARL